MNFDQVHQRHNTYSIKWDGAQDVYQNPEVIPMWIADMDFQSPKPIIEAVQKQVAQGIYGYTVEPGMTEIPSVIAQWLQQRNAWQIVPENLGYSAGVVNGFSMAIRGLTKEGDAIITQTPLYGHFKLAIEASKRQLITNPLMKTAQGYQIDWVDLETKIQTHHVKMAILCNPHNPTGRVWTPAELRHFVQICQKYQVIILSDDIHSDLILPGNHYSPLATVCPEYQDHMITFKSPSKTFNLAGFQFAYYYTTNEAYQTAMQQAASYASNPDLPTTLALPALKAAYQAGQPWLDELLIYLADNLQFLTDQIESQTKAQVTRSQATYLAWIDVSYLKVSEEQLQMALDQGGVGVQTNEEFDLTAQDGLFIRLNFATPRTILEEGIQRLIKVLQDLDQA